MKKFLGLLCILTCVLGLTACGGSEGYSEYQQKKLNLAKEKAVEEYLPNFILIAKNNLEANYAEYTPEEMEYFFEKSDLKVDGRGVLSAISSFELNKKATGDVSVDDTKEITAVPDGNKIILNIPMKGELKDANVEMVVSNDLFLELESASLNPVSNMSELMGKAALNTVLGMGTVFAVLIMISLIIACFSLIPKIQKMFEKKETDKKEVNVTGIENGTAQIAQQEAYMDESDDFELVAVIAAAIAAYEGSADASGYVVRSIRKINR